VPPTGAVSGTTRPQRRGESMPQPLTDRNLLFGILALQLDFISRDALVTAMNAWVLEKAKALGQILIEQGALTAERHALLEARVQDPPQIPRPAPARSLAAVRPPGSARQELERIADPDLQASLVQVSSARADFDPNATGPDVPPGTLPPYARFQILRPHARGGLG